MDGIADLENPVVALCVQGMEAEGEGRGGEARRLFARAWDARRDDVDAAVAGHYLARHQETREATLAWNQRALHHARAAPPGAVADFLPSLHLNVGRSLEDLGRADEAAEQYGLAEAAAGALAPGAYTDMIRSGIAAARERCRGGDTAASQAAEQG